VSHANGLSGQVDGRVGLPEMAGHKFQVSQDGKTVLVFDERTRRLVRIDPSQLTVAAAKDYHKEQRGAGLSMAAGGWGGLFGRPAGRQRAAG
jgi:hypothetical protein